MYPMSLQVTKRPMGSIEDKWVGFKGIMWNTIQNGKDSSENGDMA